uniref:Uncharacterized protein n=1 Tax=Chromera velia CCMP2878 TaxID=1169474 RepID=A0A0G4HTE9_9ALVE|mmetsp:Transcript_33315/g.66068  ORF Transcript_33315/g.66068 Transcript_33315/m.66068 type:complete len:248 (-) Transcript_33315:351-1094(-)|eukprot:Cvel_8458.t1-p1 / transcript=Cvel_8458.t1 / gene=Cvel_8458 / organism=Chromera_velia_CCMP2878 / gene_product=hypothetical protein / transcript_product=hypothetical protein / location=Cvel_scaffold467:48013-50805(-) / protein_length=247 / sequence_SO=supercontig / SO=protein_coding / is_pseudo=false
MADQFLVSTFARAKDVPITGDLIRRSALSALVGLVLGIVISMIVNCTLVEISLSAFFAMYFGVLFTSVGLIIMWRISRQAEVDSSGKKQQLMGFAAMIVLSGALCFLLERHWFANMSALSKVPLYTLLGVSVSFALVFSVVDLVNFVLGFAQSPLAKPLVESKAQVYLVLLFALLMGGIFGFIFGLMDVEDAVEYQIRLALLREEHYCFPIGAVLGGVAGFCNEYVRHIESCSTKTGRGRFDFDDEI